MVGKTPALALLSALALAGCASNLPSAPGVVAVPSSGKDLAQFHQEDASCRQYAAGRTAALPDAAKPGLLGPSPESLQRSYDVSYVQCMASHGDPVQPMSLPYAAVYSSYAYAGPGYFDPFFGPPYGYGGFGGGAIIVHRPFFAGHGPFHHGGGFHGAHGGGHGGGHH